MGYFDMSVVERLFADVLPLIYLAIGAFLTYFFGIRGKKREIEDKRIMELNGVLSDMLIVWNYLNKLSEIVRLSLNDAKSDLLFPTKMFPLIVLNTGVLNEKCFKELDNSINGLKQYDPISYFQLEGLGTRLDYFRRDYIIPFLRAKGEHEEISKLASNELIEKALKDILENISYAAALVSKRTLKRARKATGVTSDSQKFVDDLNREFYRWISRVLPLGDAIPDYVTFKNEWNKPQVQKRVSELLETIAEKRMSEVIAAISQNPNQNLSELAEKIKDLGLGQTNGHNNPPPSS